MVNITSALMKTSTENIDFVSERVAGCLDDDNMVDGDEEFVFGPCDVGDLHDNSGQTALPRRDDSSEDDGRLSDGEYGAALPSREGLSEDDGRLLGGGLNANDEGMLESGGGAGLNTNDEDMLQGRAECGSHESVGNNYEFTGDDSVVTEIIEGMRKCILHCYMHLFINSK